MEQIIELILNEFSLQLLGLIIVGASVGVIGGALPGISSTATIALLAMFAFTMPTVHAVMFLASAQVGSTYGGSITATALNIPGTPGAAATAIEGYPMAKRGEGNLALSVNVLSSFFGNAIGATALVVSMPLMLTIVMGFGSWEMFWFAIFGIMICASLSRGDFVKGLIAACGGLIISFVGFDPIHGAGAVRFYFGIRHLRDGIHLIPAMVGLFGMAEVFSQFSEMKKTESAIALKKEKLFHWGAMWKYKWLLLRTSIIGFFIGLVPGVGPHVAAWVGYNHAYTTSKNKDNFGKGEVEGLVGTESSSNACASGSFAPMLALGIPGDGVTAVILAVLLVQGVRTGPAFLTDNPGFMGLFWLAFMLAGVVMLLVGTLFGRAIIRMLTAPLPITLAFVVSLCAIGAFSASRRYNDIIVMFLFGLLGLAMNKNKFPIPPMILGIVVGGRLVDAYFRRAIMAGHGSFLPFVTRPFSAVLVSILVILLFVEFVLPVIKKRRSKKEPPQ